jgi:hypothetical protein
LARLIALALVAILAVARIVQGNGPPPIPEGRAFASGGRGERPRLPDGPIRVAALFGAMADTRNEHAFAAALSAGGWTRDGERWTRGRFTVDITRVAKSRPAIERALRDASAGHEVVYYVGHTLDGFALPRAVGYRIYVLDSCWSLQYEGPLAGADVVENSWREASGSAESFAVMLKMLDEPGASWASITSAMNAAARARAAQRTGEAAHPERYGLAVFTRPIR